MPMRALISSFVPLLRLACTPLPSSAFHSCYRSPLFCPQALRYHRRYDFSSCAVRHPSHRLRESAPAASRSRTILRTMPRRSSRASSVAAAAKIGDAAKDDGDGAREPEESESSRKDAEATLKGAEKKAKGDEATTKKAAKKVTKKATKKKKASPEKKKKASPKKKAATKKAKAGAASDDDDDGADSKPVAKKRAAPAKRKAKAKGASDDEGSAGAEKETKSPKKRTKAADHQRWTERTPLPRLWDPTAASSSDGGSYAFTVISWNVAGLRALVRKRPDALADMARKYDADVICLQETKLQEGHLDDPKLKLREHFEEKLGGYHGHWSYSLEKKGYSGTAMFIKKRQSEGGSGNGEKGKKGKKQATLGAFFGSSGEGKGACGATAGGGDDGSTGGVPVSRLAPVDVVAELGLPDHDGEGRAVVAEFPLFYLTNLYVPNSGAKLDRLGYRTEKWDADLLVKMQQLEKDGGKPVVWLGDLNVAHDEKDTWNEGAKHLAKSAGTTPEERASFERQLGAGYVDAFRHLHPEGRGHYSYWSQRAGNREPNKGLRLDYFICSKELMEGGEGKKVRVRDSYILPDELGSDHCPIVLEIEIKK